MKYRYHVLTPFTRFQHLRVLSEFLYSQGVVWHPIFDQEIPFRLERSAWIEPGYCPGQVPGWFMGHYKENWFSDHLPIIDDHRYCLLNDDDCWEPGFLETVDKVDAKVILVSMRREEHQDLLEAKPESIGRGLMGGEQIIVTGDVLKRHRAGKTYEGDWDFIESVLAENTPSYAPDAVVLFNHFKLHHRCEEK